MRLRGCCVSTGGVSGDVLTGCEGIGGVQLRHLGRVQVQRNVATVAAAGEIGAGSHARDRARARKNLSRSKADQPVAGDVESGLGWLVEPDPNNKFNVAEGFAVLFPVDSLSHWKV
jgi:hypothetical protein